MSVLLMLPADVLVAAGPASTLVEAAELQARSIAARLEAARPWTAGTQGRAARLLGTIAGLLDGRDSRIVRNLRQQPTPWHLDDAPLKGLLVRLAAATSQATEICEVVEGVAALRRRLDTLAVRFASALPRAWNRLVTDAGLRPDMIDVVLTLDELAAASSRLSIASAALEQWHDDLHAWIRDEVDAVEPGHDHPDALTLEGRYELLLRLSAADRLPAQQWMKQQLRQLIAGQIRSAGAGAGATASDPLFALTMSYAARSAGASLTAEELSTYRSALGYYYSAALAKDDGP